MKKLCLVTLMTLTGVAAAADTVAPPPAYTGRAELPAVAERATPATAADDAARLEPAPGRATTKKHATHSPNPTSANAVPRLKNGTIRTTASPKCA